MERKGGIVIKVVIDARMIKKRVHGIGRYLLEALRTWQKRGIEDKVTLLTNDPAALEQFGLTPFFSFIRVKNQPYSLGEFIEIPQAIKESGADLFHAPSISVPPFQVIPTVLTIPDLIPLHMGSPHHRLYCRTVLAKAVGYSRAITTISSFVKDDIVKAFSCPADKVHVTLLAAGSMEEPEAPWDEVAVKYALQKPFILTAGNPRPHKNVVGAIDIYDSIRKKREEKLQLAIVCRESPALKERIRQSPYHDDVILIDYVDDDVLSALYSNARVFVYASLYEGFGLPPLEAMGRGCPVVSSDKTSLSEVVGDGGILTDPLKIEEFAGKVIKLIEDEEERKAWALRGKEWAKRFSWEKFADETMAIYKMAVSSR